MLAEKLISYKGQPAIVLAIPRGGVPVALEISKALHLPLQLVLAKKIGHPQNKEYAIGAASLDDYFVLEGEGLAPAYITSEVAHIRERLQEMHVKFEGEKKPLSLTGKILILVDDGVATGHTLWCTIQMLRKMHPEKIVIAVPVASKSAFDKLSMEVDEVICLLIPEFFYAVGAFYEDFQQVEDEEIVSIMHTLNEKR